MLRIVFLSFCLVLFHSLPSFSQTIKSKDLSAQDEVVREELLRLQGTWKVESQEMNGKSVPVIDIKDRTMFFGADVFILRKGTEILQVGVQKLDPRKSPRAVDVVVTKGLYQGEKMQGIYELQGETLKICMDIEGEKRPTEFKTESGEGRIVTYYKRVPAPQEEKNTIVGKYQSIAYESDGKQVKSDAEIHRFGDAYMIRYLQGKDLAYIGIGIRKGNILSVCWANRGEIGVSMYTIDAEGKLLGEYTQLGSIGTINREDLIPKKK